MPVNPFEDERAQYLVLRNEQQEYSLWPAFADIPVGWNTVYGKSGRQDCLEYIEVNWGGLQDHENGT